MTAILSIKFGGHDCAASLMVDGELLACCEQERYSRDKHSRRFPNDAIADCLRIGSLTMGQVDEIAFVNDLKRYIREIYLRPALEDDERLDFMMTDIERIRSAYNMETRVREETGFDGPVTFHRHHLCHMASAYFPSGFDNALLACIDGFGESETSSIGIGTGGDIEVAHMGGRNPHSMGLLYSAITFFLGWKHHCDEGIVMGLASYGDATAKIPGRKRTYYDVFAEILRPTGDYTFEVDQTWMAYYGIRDKWIHDKFIDMFGPKRNHENEITDHHRNIAAALQKRLEDVVLDQLKHGRSEFGLGKLCLSGGVALNCSMNSVILKSGLFDEIFVQPASGDQGTTIGACYIAYKAHGNSVRPRREHDFCRGSRFNEAEVRQALEASGMPICKPDDLYDLTAERLEQGKIVAWFQGGAEFGPRALGNRSILCRPYPAEVKDHLNAKVKFREPFRPFAPAVLAEYAEEYFDIGQESPHMLFAVQVKPGKKDEIPATVHVDGSCRVQTVKESNNPRFRGLIEAFHRRTGVPVLLNTSFNVKGQPIVNSPEDAIDCFKSTSIDCCVIGDFFLEKAADDG